MTRTFDYEGNGSDGTTLIKGHIYMAKANGIPDKNGIPQYPEDVDEHLRAYRAVKNGSLFSMWRYPEGHGYTLPQYMEFSALRTMEGWGEKGGDFTMYCQRGDMIDEAIYDYFLGVLPPVGMRRTGFLLGECAAHNENGEGVYDCFCNDPYCYCGQCTIDEFNSRRLLWALED